MVLITPTESIQTAINSLPPEGGTVELTAGTWNISNPILIYKDNVTVKGQGANTIINYIGTDYIIYLSGLPISGLDASGIPIYTLVNPISNITLTADSMQKNITVQNASVFSIGDEVWIDEYHQKWLSSLYPNDDYRKHVMELNTISSISGNILTMVNNLENTYHVKVNSVVIKVNTVKNSSISNLQIIGNGILNSYSLNCNIKNNYIENTTTPGMWINLCNFNNTIDNNEIHTDYLNNPIQGAGLGVKRSKNITLSNNKIHSSLKNIVVENSHKIYIIGNRCEDSYSNNIEMYVGHDNYLANNIIITTGTGVNRGNGIDLRYQAYDLVENNTFVFSSGNGIKVQESSDSNIIKNNIISNILGDAGLIVNTDNWGLTFNSYNCMWNNRLDYHGITKGIGGVNIDPQFVDILSDYHLKSQYGRWNGVTWIYDITTSPIIGAGDPTSDNSLSLWGGTIEMGAYGNTPESSNNSTTICPTPICDITMIQI